MTFSHILVPAAEAEAEAEAALATLSLLRHAPPPPPALCALRDPVFWQALQSALLVRGTWAYTLSAFSPP
jgi:hypothetical protein